MSKSYLIKKQTGIYEYLYITLFSEKRQNDLFEQGHYKD